MNSSELRRKILAKSPRYAASKKEILEQISNKTGKAGEFDLGPFYQAYVYCFFIGYQKGYREELPVSAKDRKDFRKIGEWNDIPSELIEYILMILICEVNKNLFSLEEADEDEIQEFIDDLIRLMEEYANGGLSYLKDEFEKDSSIFHVGFSYMAILKDVVSR